MRTSAPITKGAELLGLSGVKETWSIGDALDLSRLEFSSAALSRILINRTLSKSFPTAAHQHDALLLDE
jgi:hypothetical protein